MSALETIRRRSPVGKNFLEGMAQRTARYRTYRRTLAELQSLSDRDLTDLGVSRLSIRSIAYKAAYGG